MDYEMKYKDLLERARKMRDENCDGCKICLESLFPELAKSEDERIRKLTIHHLDKAYQNCKFDEYKKEIEKCIAWLEKQGEQKPKWSEEDENFFTNICTIIDADRNFTESAKRRCKEWLKSIKKRMEE